MATATARRRRAIEHLVATDLGPARLARAALHAVVDGLDLGPIALRTAGDRAWVQEAVAGPIQVAADRALDALVDGLIQSLDHGEPALVARMLGHDGIDAAPPRPDRRRCRTTSRSSISRPSASRRIWPGPSL